MSCFQLSPYSLWIYLACVVGSGDDEMKETPTSQCDFMTDIAVDRLWCGWYHYDFRNTHTHTHTHALQIVQRRLTGQYYRANILTPFVVPFARPVGRCFVFQDDNARAHRARIFDAHLQQHNIYLMPWPCSSEHV